jgi:hypothetical protein
MRRGAAALCSARTGKKSGARSDFDRAPLRNLLHAASSRSVQAPVKRSLVVVAAAGTVHVPMTMIVVAVLVDMIVGVIVSRITRMVMIVPMMVMAVMVMTVIVAAGAVIVGRAFGTEGAGDRARVAALAAHQLGRRRRCRDVEHVGGDLGGHVAAAELPGQAHQPGGVFRAHLEEILRGGAHRDQPAVVEAQGVAILEGRGLGERHREVEAALGNERPRDGLPASVVEAHRVGDAVGAHRGAADDRGGCRHGTLGWRPDLALRPRPGAASGPRHKARREPGATPDDPGGTLAI